MFRPTNKIGAFAFQLDIYGENLKNVSVGLEDMIQDYRTIRYSTNLLTLGWGHSLPIRFGTHSFGVNINYNFVNCFGEYQPNALTLDLGYLLQFPIDIRFGVTVKSVFYIDLKTESDTVFESIKRDFQIGSGIGYVRTLSFNSDKKWLKISPEFCYRFTSWKEKSSDDENSPIFLYTIRSDYFFSTDLFFLNTAGVKLGMNFGHGGSIIRPEYKVSFLNHISLHLFSESFHRSAYSFIVENETQWAFGITCYNLLEWKKTDLRWWRTSI